MSVEWRSPLDAIPVRLPLCGHKCRSSAPVFNSVACRICPGGEDDPAVQNHAGRDYVPSAQLTWDGTECETPRVLSWPYSASVSPFSLHCPVTAVQVLFCSTAWSSPDVSNYSACTQQIILQKIHTPWERGIRNERAPCPYVGAVCCTGQLTRQLMSSVRTVATRSCTRIESIVLCL